MTNHSSAGASDDNVNLAIPNPFLLEMPVAPPSDPDRCAGVGRDALRSGGRQRCTWRRAGMGTSDQGLVK